MELLILRLFDSRELTGTVKREVKKMMAESDGGYLSRLMKRDLRTIVVAAIADTLF